MLRRKTDQKFTTESNWIADKSEKTTKIELIKTNANQKCFNNKKPNNLLDYKQQR